MPGAGYRSLLRSGCESAALLDGPEGLGELLRSRGREYGTVTGRPRRTGWFDGVAAAYANRINRFDGICVMLLDVLDVLDEIPLCVGYRLDGATIRSLPPCVSDGARIEAIYERLPGWKTDTTGITRWDALPAAARRYLDRLSEIVGSEVALVSVGPDRTQSIVSPGSIIARRLERT
jgi:adenylosuccinate synthase